MNYEEPKIFIYFMNKKSSEMNHIVTYITAFLNLELKNKHLKYVYVWNMFSKYKLKIKMTIIIIPNLFSGYDVQMRINGNAQTWKRKATFFPF